MEHHERAGGGGGDVKTSVDVKNKPRAAEMLPRHPGGHIEVELGPRLC